MQTFKNLIHKGEEAREKGDIQTSISLFEEALKIAATEADTSMALSHLGLAYAKEGRWELAKTQFYHALEYGERANNMDRIMEAKRHLSMCSFQIMEYATALKFAAEAVKYAREKGRTDLPWFTHACVKIILKMNVPKAQKWSLIWIETKDLISVWGKEKNKIAKKQWVKGLLQAVHTVIFN